MKIPRSKNMKKPLIISCSVIALIALSGIAAASYYKVGYFASELDNSINLSEPTDNEKNAAIDIKQRSLNQEDNKTQAGSDPATPPQTIEGSDKKSVHMEITSANQDDSTLHVRTLIQSVLNSGTCTLTLSGPDNNTYTDSVEVQPLPSSSTCKGFDVPLAKLSKGSWIITVDFSNDEIIATTTKEVTIQ